ncbi:hypothetical protein B0J14DRAFT_661998 [Halenospora varia]|nr:hypothetical protein B0J14DRAFT_661998 [Halenospora varia]
MTYRYPIENTQGAAHQQREAPPAYERCPDVRIIDVYEPDYRNEESIATQNRRFHLVSRIFTLMMVVMTFFLTLMLFSNQEAWMSLCSRLHGGHEKGIGHHRHWRLHHTTPLHSQDGEYHPPNLHGMLPRDTIHPSTEPFCTAPSLEHTRCTLSFEWHTMRNHSIHLYNAHCREIGIKRNVTGPFNLDSELPLVVVGNSQQWTFQYGSHKMNEGFMVLEDCYQYGTVGNDMDGDGDMDKGFVTECWWGCGDGKWQE